MVNLNWDKKGDNQLEMDERRSSVATNFRNVENLSYHNKKVVNKTSSYEIWENMLFWGDNLSVLFYLMKNYAEKIDLIYIDPPFFTGDNFYIDISKQGRQYDSVAYYDHWEKNLDNYLQMLYERILLFKSLLSKKGLLFIHLDWHIVHYVKLILDEVFGKNRFINNIVWYYGTTLLAAEKLERQWIGCDISEYAIYLTRKRLLSLYKKKKETQTPFYGFQLKTIIDTSKEQLINSNFFNEDLKIKRKK
ncbi:MAG: DNA methyltransferase [Candidatus Lokiarchaeota archaeon]